MPDIRVSRGPADLFHAAAAEFISVARDAVAKNGVFRVALSGGSTPKGLFALLAGELKSEVAWNKTQFFWGDERNVPPDSPDSNYRMAKESLLSHLPIDESQVHRMRGELDASVAAAEYETVLREHFHLGELELPRLDLNLLGMGPEGHTASLFPGTKALHESKRLVTSNWVGKLYTQRITMTAPVLNNSATILFLIQGEEKALALKAVLEGPYEPEQLPAQLIAPRDGRLIWMLDSTAASQLSR